jgi:uncharacterized protein YgiM (DUF1202 family)
MKMNWFLVFGTLLSASLLAQQVTNGPAGAPIQSPPPMPAAGATPALEAAAPPAPATTPPGQTNAPAAKSGKKASNKKKAGKKKAAKKAAAKPAAKPAEKKAAAAPELKTVPLEPGPASVIASNVNIRGQAKLKSEVVGHLTKDDAVTVLGEVTLNNSAPDEPSAWAKIVLPSTQHVWVNGMFVDATNKTVSATKLNLRGGPGENYSVLGVIKKGDEVKDLSAKGDWLEIEAPTNAFAFVAAQYLKQEAPAPVVATAEPTPPSTPTPVPTPTPPPVIPEPPPATNVVADAPKVALPPVEPATPAPAPAPIEPTVVTNTPPPVVVAPPPAVVPAPEPPADLPPPKRIVQREGLVRGTVSIQAPTPFELVNADNGKVMNYLYTTSTNLDLRRFKGMRIIVTGEEGLDERWRNTPVITIQRIHVLE